MAAKRVFEGLTVVTVGCILLANTTGVLPWSVWWSILLLWPLLLVAAGIDILGRALNSTALRVFGSVVVIAGLVYGALAGAGTVASPVFSAQRSQAFHAARPSVASVTTGRARVGAGLGKVTVGAGDVLASADGSTPFGEPALTATTSDGSADVRIQSAGHGTVVWPTAARSYLDATFDRSVRWESLEFDGGVSDVALDLSALDVRSLVVNTGMSTVDVTFGTRASRAEATLSGGLSSYRVRVPRDLGVEIAADNGLGSVNVRGGWQRVSGADPFSGTWRSDGYDTSASKLRLVVKTGLSSVDVERY